MNNEAIVFDAFGVMMFLVGLYLLFRRIATLRQGGKRILLSEYLGVEMLIVCLLFIAFATTMIFLLGSDRNIYCVVTIWACIFLYTTNKLFLYVYLIEKAHIVNCAFHHFERRAHSSLYIINTCSIFLYSAVLTIMIIYRKSYMDDGGECHVGLEDTASATLLIFDTMYRIYLMSLFVWPLLKNAGDSIVIMHMAKKNIFGSIVSLICSFANILYMLAMHGNQKGYLCLFLCMVDVFVNVLIMDWLLTTHRDEPLKQAVQDLEVVKMDCVVKVTHTLQRESDGDSSGPLEVISRPVFNSRYSPPIRAGGTRGSTPHKVTFADEVSNTEDVRGISCPDLTDDPDTIRQPTPLLQRMDSTSPCNVAIDITPPFQKSLGVVCQGLDHGTVSSGSRAQLPPTLDSSLFPSRCLPSQTKERPDIPNIPHQPSALHMALQNSHPESSNGCRKSEGDCILDSTSSPFLTRSMNDISYGRWVVPATTTSGGYTTGGCRTAAVTTQRASPQTMSGNDTGDARETKYCLQE